MLIDNVSLSKALNGILAAAANSHDLTITLNKDDLEALEYSAQRLSINPVGMSEAVHQQQTIQRLLDTIQSRDAYASMTKDVLTKSATAIVCLPTIIPELTELAGRNLIDLFKSAEEFRHKLDQVDPAK